MAKKPDPKKKKAPRRSRLIALEPRMLFDGALGIDLSAKATAVLQGETPAATDTSTAPAARRRRTPRPPLPPQAQLQKKARSRRRRTPRHRARGGAGAQ
jgi:hypothetical protein